MRLILKVREVMLGSYKVMKVAAPQSIPLDPRKEAQQRVDRIAAFRAELAQLEREQALVLTADQRSHLEAHLGTLLGELRLRFGIDVTESAKRVSWGMRVVSLLGGAALFAAVILFLHRVWGDLPTSAHIVVLTATPLLLLAATEVAFARRVDQYYVALLAIAAGVGFVMASSALGSILNLRGSVSILLAWGIFAVLVAYTYCLRLLLAAGLVLLCAYAAGAVLDFQGDLWVDYAQRAQWLIPPAVVLYLLPWLTRRKGPPGFDGVYQVCGAGVALTALLSLSLWGDPCWGKLAPTTVEATYQLLGLLASAAVVADGLRQGHRGLLNVGAMAFIAFLYARLHAWWWTWMPKYLFFLIVGLIAIGIALVFRRIRGRWLERANA